MATYSKTLGAHADIKAVLDTALASGGGIFTLPTEGMALSWRHRAHHYRKLLLDHNRAIHGGSATIPSTPYDMMILRIDKENPCAIIIDLDRLTTGVLTTKEGEPLIRAPSDVMDPLEEEARRLARDNDIEL